MRNKFFLYLVPTLLTLCVGVFAFQISQVRSSAHVLLRENLWELGQLHALQHKNVMLIEGGVINNYDPTSATIMTRCYQYLQTVYFGNDKPASSTSRLKVR